MKTLDISLKTSTIILRVLSALILLFVVIEVFHLFDSSVEKKIPFYYVLIVAISYTISAIGIWNLRKWSVFLYLITSLALIPGFFYMNSVDKISIGLFVAIMVGAIISWKNIK
jgi:hypothetical protein